MVTNGRGTLTICVCVKNSGAKIKSSTGQFSYCRTNGRINILKKKTVPEATSEVINKLKDGNISIGEYFSRIQKKH